MNPGQMRVAQETDSAEGRRVWYRDVEITDWSEADEFRRVVITKSGKVLNGDVRIERMECDKPKTLPMPSPTPEPTPQPKQNTLPEIPAEPIPVSDNAAPPQPLPVVRDFYIQDPEEITFRDGYDKPVVNEPSTDS